MLQRALIEAGHTVDIARDGREALDWVDKGLHRFIISDWDMPRMDGLDLCRKVRANSAHYIYFVLLTGHDTSEDIVAGMSAGADDFIVKPFKPAELLVRIRAGERLLSLETRDMAIFAMAKLADSRDKDTGKHLERVRSYADVLARELARCSKFAKEINEPFIKLLHETCPLHDIGKVGIPDQILLKPGKLTTDEFSVMKTHTSIGKDTLDAALDKFPDAQFLRFARDIVACHHERFDGSGYPAGLAGEDIPLCARIVAVADVYDALTSERVYKEAYDHESAREIIVAEAGRHFDPRLIDAFLRVETRFISIAERMRDPQLELVG
jgi:putative two-component system response regulator